LLSVLYSLLAVVWVCCRYFTVYWLWYQFAVGTLQFTDCGISLLSVLYSLLAVVSVCCRYFSYNKLFWRNGIAHLLNQTVQWLRQLVTVLYRRRSGFVFRPFYVGFMVDELVLGQGFLRVFFRYAVSVSHHSCSVFIFDLCTTDTGVRGGAVGWGTALPAGRSQVRFPMVSLELSLT
jgi:hypothetical protein